MTQRVKFSKPVKQKFVEQFAAAKAARIEKDFGL